MNTNMCHCTLYTYIRKFLIYMCAKCDVTYLISRT